jgi:hypothetical protein
MLSKLCCHPRQCEGRLILIDQFYKARVPNFYNILLPVYYAWKMSNKLVSNYTQLNTSCLFLVLYHLKDYSLFNVVAGLILAIVSVR